MPFFVDTPELLALSGRSKQDVYGMRTKKTIPFEKLNGNTTVYDIDEPKIRKIIVNHPEHWGEQQKRAADVYHAAFRKRRAQQDVTCAKTGMADYMYQLEPGEESGMLKTLDEDLLDRKKKETDIEYRLVQIEKATIGVSAAKGDTIPKTYAESYIRRYIGALHQQTLDLSATGLMDDIYNICKREKDGMKAIKECERLLENRMSDLLKDATLSMKTNPM